MSNLKRAQAVRKNDLAPTEAPAIELRDVRKVFQTKNKATPTIALDGISFTVERGEFVSLLGESGCGKSTALSCAAGLLDVDSGTINVQGRAATSGRRDVGVMFQRAALLPWKTVFDNVALPFRVFKEWNAEARQRCIETIEMVGLGESSSLYPWQLSGGMQQRVSLARILAYGPEVKLMDEPFGALDEFTRERLNIELSRIHEVGGHTVLFVTHSITEAVLLSDRVIVMGRNPGRIVGEVQIGLPRPRRANMASSPEFALECARVRTLLGTDREQALE